MATPSAAQSSVPAALLAGERQVLELIATGATMETILDTLCRVIDAESGLRSSIFLLDAAGDRLQLAAGPRLPEGWRALVTSFPITEGGCGAAVRQRQQIISPDITLDSNYDGYHDAARAAGIGGVWSTPFFATDGRTLGTFAVFSDTPGEPSPSNLALVARATHLAAIAVERHQTERGLRESEIRFSHAFYASPACMVMWALADGRFQYVNDAFVRMFGYSRDEVIGRSALALGLYADPRQRPAMVERLLHGQLHGVELQARTKSGQIRDLILSMECIDLLGERSVLAIATDITDRKRAERAVAKQEQLLEVVLNTLPVGIAVVNREGDMILTNPAFRSVWNVVLTSGRERYARSKGWWHHSGEPVAPDDWPSARARLRGQLSRNELIDIEAFDGARKTVQMSAAPFYEVDGEISGAVLVLEDVSAQKAAERALHESLTQMRALSARLMRTQDDERRRIAQMLHETTAQDVAGLKMLLSRLGRMSDSLSDAERSVLKESIELSDRVMTDVRTLSYLLHPPFLDEAGLLKALRWYVEGFTRRSGIAVELDVPPRLARLPRDVETAVFRIIQEALLNIHRHAESATATVRLRATPASLSLEIEDRGRGMSEDVLAGLKKGAGAIGVGLPGMRQRLEQLGGRLDVESSGRGTHIRAVLPVGAAP